MKSRLIGPCVACAIALVLPTLALSQEPIPAAYRTRQSQCRHAAPPGHPLSLRSVDSGTKVNGYAAERLLTYSHPATGLAGGDILVCTEYGRVEITDSDDGQVRLQIRIEGFGEGSEDPGRAAARVIDETELHVALTEQQGKLSISVWHSTLGFTAPGAQPAFVNVRLQVPARGTYRVRTEAFHGLVAIRRLTLSSATLRGNVGEKFKGIPGFIFATELDNVTLAGDVDIDNLVGLPGVRAPVTGAAAALAAPILVKVARVAANARLTAVTGGEIRVAIQPAPDLAVSATGESNSGTVRVGIDRGVVRDSSATAAFRVRREVSSPAENKPLRVTVLAQSNTGNVHVTSIPSAPLSTGR
jgi:hypothetical protein